MSRRGRGAGRRAALLSMLADLAGRAKKAGRLRRDFVIDDLVLVLLTGRGLAAVPPARRETSARRVAALVVDAFRETGTNPDSPRTSRTCSGRFRQPGRI
ncbi:hypothetical protein [Nocardia sp. NPDC002869]|uniref:hypothetical protein n=1 Tax=Nocardia sp. NPDC002869 TaxID=3161032 RepID=UPI00398CF238